MSDRKPRAPKAPSAMPKYKLDATGRHEAQTTTDFLSKGSPDEVRQILEGTGSLMRGAVDSDPPPSVRWLCAAVDLIESLPSSAAQDARDFLHSENGRELPVSVRNLLQAALMILRAPAASLGMRDLASASVRGAALRPEVAEWLGAALESIGRGEDANRALRITRVGRPGLGALESALLDHRIDDLKQQGVSDFDAHGIVERNRRALRHNDDPDALWGKTEDDHITAAENLKDRRDRRRKSQRSK